MGSALTVIYGGVQTARNLHNRLLSSVLHAPISFFDTTPLGRIVNRCNTDVDEVDAIVPLYIRLWMQEMTQMVSTFILITYTTPIFLVVLLPLMILYYCIQVSGVNHVGPLLCKVKRQYLLHIVRRYCILALHSSNACIRYTFQIFFLK